MKEQGKGVMECKLDGDLIEEILLRLPVKSLLRFKCVCKSWLSLISDPHFAKSHFELSATPSNRVLCIESSVREARSIDVDASLHDDSAVASLIPPLLQPDEPVEILGSCRGIVVLGRYQNPNLYLWNPSTGFHRQLSCPSIGKNFLNPSAYPKPYRIGFGYDPSTDDYLVVVLFHCDSMFFSFRSNSWKKFHVPFLHHLLQYREVFNHFGLFLNGAIHWLVRSRIILNNQIVCVDVILIFNLIEKNLSEIYLPKLHSPDGDSPDGGACICRLIIMGGCLTACYWDLDLCSIKILMMQEYKVESSWTVFVFNHTRYLSALCFTKGGELVACDQSKLMKLNTNGDLLEQRKYYDHTSCMAVMYRQSLISPVTGVEA